MTPELEDRIYNDVARAVIWGSGREEVMHTLEVNGITGAQAEEFYSRAKKERIKQIRSDAMRKAFLGGLILGASIGLFSVFWFGFGAITRLIYIICFGGGVWGIWWLTDGIVSMILAPSKKGPLGAE